MARVRQRAAIALGTNLGDRQAIMCAAVGRLGGLLDHLQVSRFYETEPVGMPGSPGVFLNAAATGDTPLAAGVLLEALLGLEAEFGRERPHPGASRTLDLDLILYGDAVIDEPPRLIVPHPRFRERRFVLEPLAEVAGEWIDPVTGHTVSHLLNALDANERRQP